ncbi:MAG TPA: FAD-binding and (Fe-S)-binding domain-containing protein [Puia sp.]|jgi:D-lactate dehydrogenase|nr:FAD-binding and (Fe-S)-binding domain-containing protein [Puia sp.]
MDLAKSLKKILPEERIKTRLIDLVGYASDAGFYQLIPKAVVQPANEEEIVALFHFSHSVKLPLVFRAGGTSLSGQSITDGILVDLSRFWKKIMVEENGKSVRVQPGITGAMVNVYLKKYNRKIGPDPSSISSAMMGGIISNNASGMCCGVKSNSYHTVRYLRFVLPDGNIFSTENYSDYDRFQRECSVLSNELLDLRKSILSNEGLYEKIRRKYETKNTVGYSLNALLDYEQPLEIFAHLLVGGEGTLAFISEAVLQTIPDLPYKAAALLYYPDIYAACEAILPLVGVGAEMVELMDRAALRSIENIPGIDAIVKTLPETAAAMLIEFQEADLASLESRVNEFLNIAKEFSLLNTPELARDPKKRDFLWKVRKGLFPAVGAMRSKGTTVILEDIAFPVNLLGNAILDLQALFVKYHYTNAIIFGHAKDGNIHFVITQSFDKPADVVRYFEFIREVVVLVVDKYKGTLKAEHGTGRNMAPFVETEWGLDAYKIMNRIKAVSDPMNLLNPGVIINNDPDIHIKNLKSLPAVEEEVDKCIECGYCEYKCPSKDVTLTPRRRIVVRRALVRLKKAGNHEKYRELLKQYHYDGLETCAVDGLCASVCPVDINTGDLVKRLRKENHSAVGNKFVLVLAKEFRLVESLVRLALTSGRLVNRLAGEKAMVRLTKAVRKMIPTFPLWSNRLEKPPELAILKKIQSDPANRTTVVYFPTCISRVLGSSTEGRKNIMEAFISVSEKAGIRVVIPKNISGSCCGQIFSSKGFRDAYHFTANAWMEELWTTSCEGKYSVVVDVSSCTYTLQHLRPALSERNQLLFDRLKIMDSIEFLFDWVLPGSRVKQKKGKIILHPVCSVDKMGIEHKFREVAAFYAHEVVVPVKAGCCGMAGDRGFLFPELTESATLEEAAEVKESGYDGYYSSAKTCEMAMSEAVNKNYESILHLVDDCT